LATTISTDNGKEVDNNTKVFNNGTIQTVTKAILEDGREKTNVVQSLLANTEFETKIDGNTTLRKTVTTRGEDGRETSSTIEAGTTAQGSTMHSIAVVDKTTGRVIKTEAESQLNNSVVTIRENGIVQTNAKAQTEDGKEVSIVAEAQSNGASDYALKLTDTQGKENTIIATSNVKGANTLIKSDGSIQMGVKVENRDIKIVALPNAEAQHIVSYTTPEGRAIITKVSTHIVGPQTTIETNGDVTTTVESKQNVGDKEQNIRISAVTTKDGKTLTQFGHVLKDGSIEIIGTTVSPDTPFDAGNRVKMEEINGEFQIRVITDVRSELKF